MVVAAGGVTRLPTVTPSACDHAVALVLSTANASITPLAASCSSSAKVMYEVRSRLAGTTESMTVALAGRLRWDFSEATTEGASKPSTEPSTSSSKDVTAGQGAKEAKPQSLHTEPAFTQPPAFDSVPAQFGS